MPKAAGLTIDLNNYRGFKRDMRNLDKILKAVDKRVDRVGDAFDRLENSMSGSADQFQRQASLYERGVKRIERLSDRLARTGVVVSAAISAPAGLYGRHTINAALDFESAMAGVAKTLDTTGMNAAESAAALADIEEGLQAMATDSSKPVAGLQNAHTELARIAELGGQLGIARDELLDFTETIGMMTMATDLDADSAAMSMAQFANIMSSTDFDRMGAAIVELGNNSATTEAQILEFGARLAGASRQAGMSEADVLAMGAAMASLNINAEAGGTAMTRVINEMGVAVATGNDNLEAFAHVAGMSLSEFSTAYEDDAALALQSFIAGLGELDQASQIQILDNMGFGDVRVQDTLRRLSGDASLMGESLERARDAFASNTALMTEAETRLLTTRMQLNLFNNNLQKVAISIGQAVLPVINQLIGFLLPFIQHISDANPVVFQMAAAFIAAATAAGPLLLIMSQLTAAIAFVAGLPLIPFAALGAGVVAIGKGLQWVYNSSEEGKAAMDGFAESVQTLGASIGVLLTKTGELTGGFFTDLIGMGKGTEESLLPVQDVLTGITNTLVNVTEGFNTAAFAIDSFASWNLETEFARLTGRLTAGEQDAGAAAGQTLSPLAAQINAMFASLGTIDFDGIRQFVEGILKQLQSEFTRLTTADLSPISEALENNLDQIVRLAFVALAATMSGPLGIAAFGGRIIIDAIQNDFLGAGTMLQESGVLDAIETAFAPLAEAIQSFFGILLGQDMSGDFSDFAETFRESMQTLLDVMTPIIDSVVLPGLQMLGDGLNGFFTALQDFDFTFLVYALSVVAVLLTGLGGALLRGTGAALEPLGRTLADISQALSAVTRGDLEGAGEALGSAITNIWNAVSGFSVETARGVFDFLNEIGATDITFDEFAEELQTQFGPALAVWMSVFNAMIIPGLQALQEGIQGFLENVSQADANVLGTLLETLVAALLGIQVGGLVMAGALMQGLGNALPHLGSALADFSDSLNALLTGNFEEAALRFGAAIGHVGDALAGFALGAAEGVFNFLKDLFGWDTSFEEVRAQFEDAFGPVADAFRTLGDGLKGFWNEIQKIDFSQLQPIVDFSLAFSGAVAVLGMVLSTGIVTGVGEALPSIGAAIREFVNMIGAILRLDIGAALISLKDGILELFNAAKGFMYGSAKGVYNFLNDLLGLDLPEFDKLAASFFTFIDGLEDAAGSVWRTFQVEFDRAKRAIEKGIAILSIQLQEFIIAMEAATPGGVSPGREDALTADIKFVFGRDTADHIAEQFQNYTSSGILANEMFQIDTAAGLIDVDWDEAIRNPRLMQEMSLQGKMALEDALETAATEMDTANFSDLLIASINAGINFDNVNADNADFAQTLLGSVNNEDLGFTLSGLQGTDLGQSVMSEIMQQIGSAQIEGETGLMNILIGSVLESGMSADQIAASIPPEFGLSIRSAFQQYMDENTSLVDPATAADAGLLMNLLQMDALDPEQIMQAMSQVGADVQQGLADGITEGDAAANAATQMTDDVRENIETGLETRSPSEFTRRIGMDLMLGLSLGMMEGGILLAPALLLVRMQFTMLFTQVQVAIQQTRAGLMSIRPAMMLVAATVNSAAQQMVLSINTIGGAAQNVVKSLQEVAGAIGAMPGLPVVNMGAVTNMNIPAMAEGGRGMAGAIYRVAEPSIGGLELLHMDGGGSYIVASQGFTAVPPQSGMVRPPRAGGMPGGGQTTNVQYGDVTIQVPAHVAQVTPEVIARGLERYHATNPPQRKYRGQL